MKWQKIPKYPTKDEEGVIITQYRLKKFLGFRFHSRPEIEANEFRLCYFRISSIPFPFQCRDWFIIYIPFLKHDIDLIFRHVESKIYL